MGKRPFPEAQLDREKNNQGYNKDNCRWITHIDNNQNKSTTKLSIEKVRDIRKKYKLKNISQKELSIIHNVAVRTINNVLNNKTWVEG